jgi:hypothetical protein
MISRSIINSGILLPEFSPGNVIVQRNSMTMGIGINCTNLADKNRQAADLFQRPLWFHFGA